MINKLDINLVNKIAAGEVVERPASVVKELVENSLDAGATDIKINIERGGRDLIEVIDNGEGMSREDAIKCIQRYATSKINSIEDLENIRTLGFRGEALAAISSVSMFNLKTKRSQDMIGTDIKILDKDKVKVGDVGIRSGTIVSVRNLFFNTPARRKFLKSERTEFNNILNIVTQFSLIWHNVRWQLKHNNKLILNFPLTDDWVSRIKDVLGNELANDLFEVNYDYENIVLHGYVALPKVIRNNRKQQFLFVNKRSVVDGLVSIGVKKALEPMIGNGYPVFVLSLEIDPSKVDVNVHPRKTEVRFADQNTIYNIVFNSVKKGLEKKLTFKNINSDTKHTDYDLYTKNSRILNVNDKSSAGLIYKNNSSKSLNNISYNKKSYSSNDIKSSLLFSEIILGDDNQDIINQKLIHDNSLNFIKEGNDDKWIVHGQIRRSFIIVETNDSLVLFDQHAAAEAVLFEKLKKRIKQERKNFVQKLITPITIDLAVNESAILESYQEQFMKLGFEIENFGANVFIIHAIPVEIKTSQVKDIICGILQDFVDERKTEINPLDRLLKYTACRSAIKFNDVLGREEQENLIKEVQEFNVTHCPHGRPIYVKWDWKDLEKMFKRR